MVEAIWHMVSLNRGHAKKIKEFLINYLRETNSVEALRVYAEDSYHHGTNITKMSKHLEDKILESGINLRNKFEAENM